MSDKKKILMIRTDWSNNPGRIKKDGYGGIGYYRIVKPAQYLREFYDITVVGKKFADFGKDSVERMTKIFNTYDLVYVRQADTPRVISDLISAGRHFGVPVILDLDDNLLQLRPDNPAYKDYGPGTTNYAVLCAVVSLVSGMGVSTDPLKSAYSGRQKRIDVLPNCNDLADWPKEKRLYNDGMIRLGWAGSLTHDADLDLILAPLKKILEKYQNVRVEFMGGVTSAKAKQIVEKLGMSENQLGFIKGTADWDGYPQALAATGWDIALVPLVDDPFNRGKSHIKWLEMSMLQIPCVASKTYPYYKKVHGIKTIQNGKTGFLCNNDKDWFNALEKLINNPDLRAQVGYNAYEYIKNNWQWSQNIHRWKKVFDSYLK